MVTTQVLIGKAIVRVSGADAHILQQWKREDIEAKHDQTSVCSFQVAEVQSVLVD